MLLYGEKRVVWVVVNLICETGPVETNRRRTKREVGVTRCCDLGGCSTGIFDCGLVQRSSRSRSSTRRTAPLTPWSSQPLSPLYPQHTSPIRSPFLSRKRSAHITVCCIILICGVIQTTIEPPWLTPLPGAAANALPTA
jgi:hypothetical protein